MSDFVFSGNTMTINKAIYGDDSQYCCMATNEAGSISECVTITLMSESVYMYSIIIDEIKLLCSLETKHWRPKRFSISI